MMGLNVQQNTAKNLARIKLTSNLSELKQPSGHSPFTWHNILNLLTRRYTKIYKFSPRIRRICPDVKMGIKVSP